MQPPFYYHSETELELLIGEKLAVAVIQNIIADQSCRVNLPSVQESKKKHWSIVGEDEQF